MVRATKIITREREGAEAQRKAIYIRLVQQRKASQDGDSRRGLVAVAIVKMSLNHLKERVWKAETPREDCEKPRGANTHPHKGCRELGGRQVVLCRGWGRYQ